MIRSTNIIKKGSLIKSEDFHFILYNSSSPLYGKCMIANSFISCFIGSLIYLDGDTTCFINFLQSAIIFSFLSPILKPHSLSVQ